MSQQIIVAIQYHRVLGYIFKPFLARYNPDVDVWKIQNNITAQDVTNDEWGEAEANVVRLAGEYSDSEILRRFARTNRNKNKGIQQFYDSVSEDYIKNHIQPYVQKKGYQIVEWIKETEIPVLFKEKQGLNLQLTKRIYVQNGFAEPLFQFRYTDEGICYSMKYSYNGNPRTLKGLSHVFLSLQPCAVVVNDILVTFRQFDGNKLKPFFSKDYIQVPKHLEDQYFKGFVKKVVRDYDVIAEGFEVEEHRPEPKWKLTLTKDISGSISLELSFDYLKKKVLPSDDKKNLVVLHEDQGIRYDKIIRNHQSEEQAEKNLKQLELQSRDGVYFFLDEEDIDGIKLVTWLNRLSGELSTAGFTLIRGSEAPKYHIGPVRLDTTLRDETNDWFDVYAVVKAGTFEIPFIHLRKHLLKGDKFYKLPDGSIFIIPDEWFEQYADLMTYAQKGEEDTLLIRKYHYTLLKDAGIEKEAQISESLEELYSRRIEKNIELPQGLKARLRPYQKEGYAWLHHLHQHGFGGCLADDMGLGKTVQALALLLKVASEKEGDESVPAKPKASANQLSMFEEETEGRYHTKTSLVIMPTSLVHNWEAEIAKFAPQLKVLVYRGRREGLIEKFPEYDIVLTSYGVARIDSQALKAFSFFYIILDESQYVKNPESKTYKAITSLVSDYSMVLTGTPIENSLTDLWAQLNFLNEGLLGNYSNFIEKFVTPIEKKKDEAQEERLNRIIQPFLLRRKKSDVAKELPPLSEQVYYCEMTEEQHEAYERYKSGVRNSLIDNLLDQNLQENRMQVLEALLRLRQMSNHPVLNDEDYEGDSGKFNEIVRTIEALRAEGHKAIFFSSFVQHLKLIARYLREQGYPHAMLTGQTRNRKEEVRKFQEDKDIKFFLISLKAGGTGLNLTAAGYVFILDPWWNPAAEAQALNRAHRIGQEKNVFVYRFISRGSIEEKIYKLQKRKSKLAETFINSNDPFRNMSAGDIKELFR